MVKARLKTIQTSFTSGELGEVLTGRINDDLYYKGAERIRNMYCNPQGHLTRREGTKRVDSTTSNAIGRMIPFDFSTTQRYLLVLTAGQIKVYKDDVLQATISSSPISTLTLAQIQELDYTQSANILFLFHKDFQTIQITRTSHTSWSASNLTYKNIPWFAFSGVSVTTPSGHVTPSGTSGRDVLFTAQVSNFSSASVGQYIYNKQGGIARITSFISATQVKCRIEVDFPNTNNILEGNWELETGYEPSWSATRGWPSCGTFHQNRLWLGNSGQRPQSVWASKVGDFFNFDIGSSADDDAIDFTIDDNSVNAILNIVSGRNLQIYTTGGEFFIPTDPGNPITPSKILIPKATSHGSSKVKPIAVGGATLFVETSGRVVRQFTYNDLEQNYSATNVSILSPHLIDSPVSVAVRQSRADSPADYFYAVNSDGTMAVLNTARDQELLAWSLFETQGSYEDVCALGPDVYVIVKRNINNSVVRFIEKFSYDYTIDAATILTSLTPTTNWSGLSYLNGQIVKVRGDEYMLADTTPASGNITTEISVSKVEVGLMFSALIRLLPVEAAFNGQQLAGDYKRIVYINLRLINSRQVVIKVNGKRYLPPFDFFGNNVLDTPVSLFSGWKKVFLLGVKRDAVVEITQDNPLELKVLAVVVAIK